MSAWALQAHNSASSNATTAWPCIVQSGVQGGGQLSSACSVVVPWQWICQRRKNSSDGLFGRSPQGPAPKLGLRGYLTHLGIIPSGESLDPFRGFPPFSLCGPALRQRGFTIPAHQWCSGFTKKESFPTRCACVEVYMVCLCRGKYADMYVQ